MGCRRTHVHGPTRGGVHGPVAQHDTLRDVEGREGGRVNVHLSEKNGDESQKNMQTDDLRHASHLEIHGVARCSWRVYAGKRRARAGCGAGG